MNTLVTLVIAVAAARAAHSMFAGVCPGTRFFGLTGTSTIGLLGAGAGALIGFNGEPPAGDFSSMNVFWSTFGAVMLLGGSMVLRARLHSMRLRRELIVELSTPQR